MHMRARSQGGARHRTCRAGSRTRTTACVQGTVQTPSGASGCDARRPDMPIGAADRRTQCSRPVIRRRAPSVVDTVMLHAECARSTRGRPNRMPALDRCMAHCVPAAADKARATLRSRSGTVQSVPHIKSRDTILRWMYQRPCAPVCEPFKRPQYQFVPIPRMPVERADDHCENRIHRRPSEGKPMNLPRSLGTQSRRGVPRER